ncbi:MAG: hypothetical protein H6641_02155 [Caldilineaceae bacterium]|nr:hypothetical protein [Caldilineaceae bacterium]
MNEQNNPMPEAGADKPNPVDGPETRASAERTPIERAADIAKTQASVAADALRRGEFMRESSVDPAASSDDRLIALLCYGTQILIPLVMPMIVLLSESSKKRPFQRYHAIQSLALMVVFIAIGILVSLGIVIINIVPIIGWLIGLLAACLSPIGYLMGVIALLYYGAQSYQGKRFAIPGLTSFLRDQGWL